ncbi:MAG: sensor histidine kinase [Eubacteriales bacterium]
MQLPHIRHLLEGYNTTSDYVLATVNNKIIFVNRAASEIIGINMLGEPICDIIGKGIYTLTAELASQANNSKDSISVSDCDFLDRRCMLNVFFGTPTLYIFSPLPDNYNDQELSISPSSLLGFATEVRRQIAPVLFNNKNIPPAITKSGYQIIRLISNFADYIRLNSETPMLFFLNTDIVSLCQEIVLSARPILAIKGIQIRFDSQHQSFILSADPQLIRRAVMNLICNSAKYTREGNKIVVSIRFSSERCFISVSDNGTGMSQSEIADAFKSYETYQFPRTTGGYGMGLALVRKIALLHGGSAVLATKEDQGTDVTISLPTSKVQSLSMQEIVIGSSFDSALLELAELLTPDEFEKAYKQLQRKLIN